LRIIFEDLRNTGDDHFDASSGLIPKNNPLINLDGGDEGGDSEDVFSEEEVTPPPKGKGKRIVATENDKGKRLKISAGQCMQDQISRIMSFHERSATSVESIVTRKEKNKGLTIKEVMTIVKECGAALGTKEFFIASELFTKKAKREIFMTLDTTQERFEWLTMKHFVKYSN
jgi:hypothetical protein